MPTATTTPTRQALRQHVMRSLSISVLLAALFDLLLIESTWKSFRSIDNDIYRTLNNNNENCCKVGSMKTVRNQLARSEHTCKKGCYKVAINYVIRAQGANYGCSLHGKIFLHTCTYM